MSDATKELKQAYKNLTETQERCKVLLEENRALTLKVKNLEAFILKFAHSEIEAGCDNIWAEKQ